MRFHLFAVALVVTTLTVATGRAQGPPAAVATISDVSWLAGRWVQDSTAMSVEESWSAPAGGVMLAFSRTLRGGRMAAFEFLRIVEKNNGLVYVAQPGGQLPTEFVLTRLESRSATFENPQHDFPKVIRYAVRADGRLEARVSNGGAEGETYVYTRDAR
jgi:hypothetical protein